MCQPYWKDGSDGYAGLDLTSLDERDVGVPDGVVVIEINDGVDIDSRDSRSLKYDNPNMEAHDIGRYLSYDELKLIASAPDDDEEGEISELLYGNLSEKEQARYNDFGDAWIKKLTSEGPPALPVPVPAILSALPGPVPVAAPEPDELI